MTTLEQIRRTIARIDGADVLAEADARGPQNAKVYAEAFYLAACGMKSARGEAYRRADLGDVDPVDGSDTDHRAARGANANAGSYGAQQKATEMPPITTAQEWKRAASALGARPAAIRSKILAALREKSDLVGSQVLAVFEQAWQYGDLDKESDDEAEKAGDAHSDEEELAKARLRTANRDALNAPSKADARRATTAIAKARSK